MRICEDYIERCYAGWLGKIAGVRLGAPIEGWTYSKIRSVLGDDVYSYIVNYNDFAADDDTNGPVFFLRALEDFECSEKLTAEQIGKTWLNYTPYEHGFYWWGGYGISTEHTAYLNLRSGIPAPRSGSIEQNGTAVAEQIGGQIFIDTWGLVNPGNPQRAADFARKAASVSHDGEGIYGGQFVAACIAAAFTERDICKVIETGLSVIPSDCEYARMAKDVIGFHDSHPENWRECFEFIFDNYGYDKYPGSCHIIPNSAVMILSMLYGRGDYEKTVCICNMCGWDTDCTAGNVGTILGVLCGLDKIDYAKWFGPIHDFLACSSVMGSLNIMDVPWAVFYMARIAYKLAGEAYPVKWAAILEGDAPRYHFALPCSTHSFRIAGTKQYQLMHEDREDGSGLKVWAAALENDNVEIFCKTYYRPADFTDSRYNPSFSPILYPGQTVTARVRLDDESIGAYTACAYVLDGNSGDYICGERVKMLPNTWYTLKLDIPAMDGGCIERAGVLFEHIEGWYANLVVHMDYMDFSGKPNYRLDFAKERTEVWTPMHKEISQFTTLKGLWHLEDGLLHGSGADYAEAYTGDPEWSDISITGTLLPIVGNVHQIMARVQGACRSYAVRLCEGDKVCLMKNVDGVYHVLAETEYVWQPGNEYTLTLQAIGNTLIVLDGDKKLMHFVDRSNPYLHGAVGVGVVQGHCAFQSLIIRGV